MAEPMTLDQIRDRIAEMAGCKRTIWFWGMSTNRSLTLRSSHPIPPSLDWLVRVWPEGWEWTQYWGDWKAYVAFGQTLDVDGTNDELTDRMSLLLKVLDWLKSNDLPAFTDAIEKIRKEVR